jgi:hypothetical protein
MSIIEFCPVDRSNYIKSLLTTRTAHRAHVLICQGNANPLIPSSSVNDSRTLTVGGTTRWSWRFASDVTRWDSDKVGVVQRHGPGDKLKDSDNLIQYRKCQVPKISLTGTCHWQV